MVPGLIFLIIILSLVLMKSADVVVVSIRRIAKETHTQVFALSAIILALATSFPELFVGITSAIEGASNLSLGVVLGSNIANIALVGGLTAFFVGKVHVYGEYMRRDVWIAFLAGILPIILASDGILNRIDGLILLTIYFAYSTGFFKKRYIEIGKEQQEEGFVYRFMRRFNHIDSAKSREFGKLFLGIAVMLFSADSIVKLSKLLAIEANIPLFLVGLFILAAGTSLPEFAFSLRSLEDHEPSMFFGNLLGSVIANSTLIVGVVSLIRPIEIFAFNEYLVASIFFVILFIIFIIFIRTKHRLDRWEAAVLLLLYSLFLFIEFTRL